MVFTNELYKTYMQTHVETVVLIEWK